jgi:hypothetical protein
VNAAHFTVHFSRLIYLPIHSLNRLTGQLMKSCIIVLAALLLAAAALAQPAPTPLWNVLIGGPNPDGAASVSQALDGGFYVAGVSQSTTPGSTKDFFILRIETNGDTAWARLYGTTDQDSAASVQTTPDSGCIVAGTTFSSTGHRGLIMKIQSNGDTLWTRRIGNTPSTNTDIWSVRCTADGYVIAGGGPRPSSSYSDIFVAKLDLDGVPVWQRTYGGVSVEQAYNVEPTADGGFIVAGYTMSYGAGSRDGFLLKLAANGDSTWMRTYGGTGSDEIRDVHQVGSGGYVLCGSVDLFNSGSSDMLLSRTDANGSVIWSRTFGSIYSDGAISVAQCNDAGFVMVGYVGSTANNLDARIVRTNSSGDSLWIYSYGGNSYDIFNCVRVTQDGGMIIAGVTNSFGHGASDVVLIRMPGQSGVMGYVRDHLAGHQALPGVWVSAVGQPYRSITDMDGHFVVNLDAGTYSLITWGPCTERDTVRGVQIFADSLVLQDMEVGHPDEVVSESSLNLAAYNHEPTTGYLHIRNDGDGVLDYWLTAQTISPALPWLTLPQPTGSVLPQDSSLVPISAVADTDAGAYQYQGNITVRMNSCPDSVKQVLVLFEVLHNAVDPATLHPITYAFSSAPNPFNPSTTISYSLPREGVVTLKIYDVAGREVRTLVDGHVPAGAHHLTFDGAALPSGVYFARISTGDFHKTEKLLLLK